MGSESLLRSAEMYGNYFATALTSDNVNKSAAIMETKGITENNIGKLLIVKTLFYQANKEL